jgi:hypothetical protein
MGMQMCSRVLIALKHAEPEFFGAYDHITILSISIKDCVISDKG